MRLLALTFATLLASCLGAPALAGHDQGVQPVWASWGCNTQENAESLIRSGGGAREGRPPYCISINPSIPVWVEEEFPGYAWGPGGEAMLLLRLHDRVGDVFWSWKQAPGRQT
jgi:hypothetical protein